MKKVKVTNTRYKCENCGATFKDEYHIYPDDKHGEFCDKCSKKVCLADHTYYDFCDPTDFCSKVTLVNPKLVKACDLDLELDWEVYAEKVAQARVAYTKAIRELDEAYLAGNIREYNTKNRG